MILIVLLCQSFFTTCSQVPSDYFGRKDINSCITLEQVGKYACNGVIKDIPTGLIVPETNEDYEYARDYCTDHEYGHYICLEFPNRCSR